MWCRNAYHESMWHFVGQSVELLWIHSLCDAAPLGSWTTNNDQLRGDNTCNLLSVCRCSAANVKVIGWRLKSSYTLAAVNWQDHFANLCTGIVLFFVGQTSLYNVIKLLSALVIISQSVRTVSPWACLDLQECFWGVLYQFAFYLHAFLLKRFFCRALIRKGDFLFIFLLKEWNIVSFKVYFTADYLTPV